MPITRSCGRGTSYLAKLAAYREVIGREVHRTRLGVPNLLVLTVTTDQARCVELICRSQEQAGEAPPFLFQAVGAGSAALAKPVTALLTAPWERPGLPPLHIDG